MPNDLGQIPVFLTEELFRASLPEFIDLYKSRPILNNAGGMGFNHSWALWYLVRKTNPKIIVESGVWKGHSTWIIERACPNAQLYCFDINLKNLEYKSNAAIYFEDDFTKFDWSKVDIINGMCLFDDHQNILERIIKAKWFGFQHIIIEDNWPVGEGDCYSIRHAIAGTGFPKSQMSSMYLGSRFQQFKRRRLDQQLMKHYDQQSRLVKPNSVDILNLRKNTKFIFEMNPVFLEKKNNWGGEYTNEYESKSPLLSVAPIADADYSYSYLTYLKF
jgi:hypothetical protein